jgi:hypothetical protein
MSDIQRYSLSNRELLVTIPDDTGALVYYADHVEALREAENDKTAHGYRMYEAGQRDALAAAVQRVEGLRQSNHDPALGWQPWMLAGVCVDKAIAAIKGDQ